MTRDEISESIKKGVTSAFLPFGSTEQHGPHLITGYDYLFAERLAADLAMKFGCFVLPSIPYGMADHHIGFHGTISVKSKTLILILRDICQSLELSGIKKVFICNGHGGNYELINEFSNGWFGDLEVCHDYSEKLLFSSIKDWSNIHDQGICGLHGGLFETSMALFTHPIVSVREKKMFKGSMPSGVAWTSKEIEELITKGLFVTAPTGIVGDPTGSNYELGEKFYIRLLNSYIDYCKELSF